MADIVSVSHLYSSDRKVLHAASSGLAQLCKNMLSVRYVHLLSDNIYELLYLVISMYR